MVPGSADPSTTENHSVVQRIAYSHVEPASLDMKRLLEVLVPTPTKIRGVAEPEEPEVESNVTNAIPCLSLLYPLVSVGSGT